MNAGHGAQPPQGAQPQSSSGQPALVLGDPAHSGGLKLDEHCGPFQPIWFCDSMISWLLCVPVAFLGVVQVFPARDLFSLSSLCPSLPSRDGSGAPSGSALGRVVLLISPPKVPCQGCAPRTYSRRCLGPSSPSSALPLCSQTRAVLRRGAAGTRMSSSGSKPRRSGGAAAQSCAGSRAGAALRSEPRSVLSDLLPAPAFLPPSHVCSEAGSSEQGELRGAVRHLPGRVRCSHWQG